MQWVGRSGVYSYVLATKESIVLIVLAIDSVLTQRSIWCKTLESAR
jgi:hypothetical protein